LIKKLDNRIADCQKSQKHYVIIETPVSNTVTHHISSVISPDDGMFDANKMDDYMAVSASAIRCIKSAISMSGRLEKINRILDLPCGHGRVLRSLKACWPDADITACDIEKEAVDFCVETFGVNGVYSDNDVTKINLPYKYDIIWCGSLFTHFTEDTSRVFLDFLLDRLDDKGILVVTLHGRFSKTVQEKYFKHIDDDLYTEALAGYDTTGYGYAGYPGYDEWGVSIQKPSWTLGRIQDREDLTVIYFAERFWAGNHDVLAVMKKSINEW